MEATESIRKYMATELITFTAGVPIKDAIKTILKNKITGAPVIDQSGALIGILSEKDCIRTIIDGPYNQMPTGTGIVGDYMSRSVKTVNVDHTVQDLAYLFTTSNYRRFPVLDHNGKLVGQISRSDILRAIDKLRPVKKVVPSSWKGREPVG